MHVTKRPTYGAEFQLPNLRMRRLIALSAVARVLSGFDPLATELVMLQWGWVGSM